MMLYAVADSLNDVASCHDAKDGDDEEHDEQDTELAKLSEDDESAWAMNAHSQMVHHHMEGSRQNEKMLNKLTHLDWGGGSCLFR
jgi:hypothetical protein